jgi:DNA recombination protein RmuC
MELVLIIINSVLVIGVIVILFTRKQAIVDIQPQIEELKKTMREEFNGSRKELREVNTENRREINENFKGLQDTLLKRISENISLQKEQLDSFSRSLADFKDSVNKSLKESAEGINAKQDTFTEKTTQKLDAFGESIKTEAKENRTELNKGLKSFEDKFAEAVNGLNENFRQKFSDLNKQQMEQNKQAIDSIKEVKGTIDKQLEEIRKDNEKQLTEMRNTVDEKLQTTLEKRLGESFKQVSERLEQVHKGLGEMQNIATGVGDLKKVLSNVKTRGVLGEYQLANILEQILTPDQYGKNVATKKGSQANVEYAIKLPGKNTDEEVWMPVDSKFPVESYQILLNAYDEGIPENIESAQKVLLKAVEGFAKDISEKYLDPPHTTDFGIMFLPIESLYAEVLRHPGLFEVLQNKYHITVTGPTTLSALLSSLQMGFRTLAVQKRSSEVWKILEAVKTEFGKFSGQLAKVQKQLNTASGSLENLRSTRTNQIVRKLKDVQGLETGEAKEILELSDENFIEKTEDSDE